MDIDLLRQYWTRRFAAMARAGGALAMGMIALAASGGPALADLTISGGTTSNVSCSDNTCTATAADAVLNVSTLETLLASSSVKLATGTSASNIVVSAAVSWTSSSTLALDARVGITVTKPIAVEGAGGMALVTNDGGIGGTLAFVGRGRIAFLGTSNALTIDGASYQLANSIPTLAADIAADPGGRFALSRDCDAAKDGIYAHPPIPTTFDAPFTGTIEGLGNTLSHLTIDDASASDAYVGLVAVLAGNGSIDDLRLDNTKVRGATFAGGFVGLGYGTSVLRGDSVSGRISSTGINGYAGGIAAGAANIANSSSDAVVTGGEQSDTGGLAGATAGPVTDSHATGNVTAGQNSSVGGLIGYAGSTVADSSASGTVTGTVGSVAGGLVGVEYKSVVGSHAAGAVHGDSIAGGLIGAWEGLGNGTFVRLSYATGTVSGGSAAGGLVGNNSSGSVEQSFATGAVTGGGAVGGLVGSNGTQSSVRNSYATGAVVGGTSAGGLVGNNVSAITDCYATGRVSGVASSFVGGFAGTDTTQGGIVRSYWDTDTSGISDAGQGAGNIANDPGIAGLTTAQFQSGLPSGFSDKVWNESAGINGGLPYLRRLPPP